MQFSIHWERGSRSKNIIEVTITFLDEAGNCEKQTKYYEEWIAVCTNDIEGVADAIRKHFPKHRVLYKRIGQAKKVLPYFKQRLAEDKLDYLSEPFYKVYTTACHKDVGQFFKRYEIGFFDPDDWLVRIYIDLCTRYDTNAFYYKWYEVGKNTTSLVDSLRMVPDRRDPPDWTIAAFDLEAVPLAGNHMPMGYHDSDRIVMASLYKWNRREGIRKWVLYLLPEGARPCRPLDLYEEVAFETESAMLIHLHSLLEDAQVLTGYNINDFDLACIFARCVQLGLWQVLKHYRSFKVGVDLVTTYKNKIVIDLYTYFKIFSNYGLPSFKLDDVARVKLKGETKLPVKSTGIWSWYRNPVADLMEERSARKCFEALNPKTAPSEFGTFRTYMDYCLRDSELVYRLFEKEHVLSFLVERANFTALSAVEVMHLGNSRYLLELFKTYGTRLGFFVNPVFFENSSADFDSEYETLFRDNKTYQGALNFCRPESVYEDVSVMDFTSMYPSALLSSNLCYGTCTVMTRDEWLSDEKARRLTAIPYRQHSDSDFVESRDRTGEFSYPSFDPDADEFVIVINTDTEAFLPQIVSHFLEMRRHHQREWKRTGDVYHHNVQLGIKILINSLYGVMANKDSPLTYLPIAMTIVTLSRYQLLGSYHFLKNEGYDICYADTDSLMVHRWPEDRCDRVNEFLNIPNVELKYEQRMVRLLVISKKRYVYERSEDNVIVTKGFQKKTNGLVKFMTETILGRIWDALFVHPEEATLANGWILWVEIVSRANYMCRDPKKYSIYRKIKNLSEYKSTSCPSVKFLKKYPDKFQEHVEFTYSRADVAATEATNWVMDVEDCQWVNYEQLFISQKRIFCLLLNMVYWHSSDPVKSADMVLNTLHWKRFVLAELLHWHATGKRIVMLVEPSLKYTFSINDHLKQTRRPGRKRKKVQL